MSVSEHPIPYNGTIFTLTGVVQLDQSVDTDITASGVWSTGDGPQETTSPPYPTNITFQPLASNSSGEYTLTVTVRPSDNSQFIVGNSASTTYNLVVQRKLSMMDIFMYVCIIIVIFFNSTALPFPHYYRGIASSLA